MRETQTRENLVSSQHFVFVFGDENAFFSRNLSEKSVAVESTKSIKIRMPEQSNDYRVVTFGSGGVGKSSLGEQRFPMVFSLLCTCPPTSNEASTQGGNPGRKNVFLDFAFHFWHRKVPRTNRIPQSAAR